MSITSYPMWTVPVAAGHQIANVREQVRVGDDFVIEAYALVIPKSGFSREDWDAYLLDN